MRCHRRRVHFGRIVVAIGLLIVLPREGLDGRAAPQFGDWSAPVNLGPLVNTEFAEFAPQVSKNELSLYFASTRPESFGSYGGEDLWVAQRADVSSPWAPPLNLGPMINTGSNERSPALSRDGHYLFFASDRPGSFGALDIWVSWRPQTHDDLGWEPPVNLGTGVNSSATDAGPNFLENDEVGVPQLYLASNRGGGLGGLDIYVSALVGGSFQTPVLVQELSTAQGDLTPGIRHDGLEIVIASTRPGGVGGQDLWVAIRETVNDSWSAPVNAGQLLNTAFAESFPSISGDRTNLYFNSNLPSGFGDSDLYVSTRGR